LVCKEETKGKGNAQEVIKKSPSFSNSFDTDEMYSSLKLLPSRVSSARQTASYVPLSVIKSHFSPVTPSTCFSSATSRMSATKKEGGGEARYFSSSASSSSSSAVAVEEEEAERRAERID
jgi:hypothetical protein